MRSSSASPKIMKLICDTDFLIKVTGEPLPALAEFLANEDFQLVTIPAVVRELRGLTRSKTSSTSRKAINALRSVDNIVKVVDQKKSVHETEADIELYEHARLQGKNTIVATLDGKLLSRFERNHLPYFTLRHDKPFLRSFS
jgi:rRNA-processing protein FCF1